MNLKRSKLYAESWNVAFRMKQTGSILDDKATPFIIVPNNNNSWAADPMVFKHNGEIYIFAELYDYKLRRGTIGFTKYNGSSFNNWTPIITEPFHMSYPFVFEHNGEIYMLPETSGANSLILYKATEFPYKWQKEKTIIDNVKWVDTTLFKQNDSYIGYTESVGEIEDFFIKLNNDLEITDIKKFDFDINKNRCGGRMFKLGSDLVRVCQDCTEKYGGALFFRKHDIDTLDEKEIIRIIPSELSFDKTPYLDGMHTYTSLDNIEVIDIKTRRLNFINLFYRLISKF